MIALSVLPVHSQSLKAYRDQNNDAYVEWTAQEGYSYKLQSSDDLQFWNDDSTWVGFGQTISVLVQEGPAGGGGGGGGGAIPGLPQYTFGVVVYQNGDNLISWKGEGGTYQLYTTDTYFSQGDDPLFQTDVTDPNGDYTLFLYQFGAPLPPNAANLTLAALPQVEQDRVNLLIAARQQIVNELAANGGSSGQSGVVGTSVGDAGYFRLIISREDSDGDGLYNDLENSFGLNPYDPDTDADGVIDPWDVANFSNLILSEFMAQNDAIIRDEEDDYEDYIEIYNPTSQTVDLSGWYLGCNQNSPLRWRFPFPAGGILLSPGESLVVFASGDNRTDPTQPFHTDFGLSVNGEDLILSNPSGIEVDSHLDWGRQRLNASAGWALDQSTGTISALRYFLDPTPGSVNSPSSCSGLSRVPSINVNGGVFSGGSFSVNLSSTDPTDIIYYTLDGENPTDESLLYDGSPLNVDETTILRAMAVKPGCIPSPIVSRSYLFIEDIIGTGGQGNPAETYQIRPEEYQRFVREGGLTLGEIDYSMDPNVVENQYNNISTDFSEIPTVSLALPRDLMFGINSGIYARSGDTSTAEDPLGNDWRRLGSIEYIDPSNGSSYVQENCEIAITGSSSRFFNTTDKHSFRLLFKTRFSNQGSSRIVFNNINPPFSTTGTTAFKQLNIRQPTQDSWALKWDDPDPDRAVFVRETWAREMHRQMNPSSNIFCSRRWTHLFINGLYWGIYELGERIDENFARSSEGDSFGDYDVVRQDRDAVDGDYVAYDQMISACEAARDVVNDQGLWNDVTDILDIDSYIDYLIINMFMYNEDWISGNNWRALRRRTDLSDPNDVGKFRFVVWDAEFSMNLNDINDDITDGKFLGQARGALEAHGSLLSHPNYQSAWRARVQLHFETPGGVFYAVGTDHNASDIFDDQMTDFDKVVSSESARWGDSNRQPAYERSDWLSAADDHKNSFIKNRRAIFLTQLRNRGLANP